MSAVIFNTDLKLIKESDGLYTVSIPGSITLHHVARMKLPSSSYYFKLERNLLYVLRTSDDKMIARCEIKSKECLQEDRIHGNWDVYNPPVKKRSYY